MYIKIVIWQRCVSFANFALGRVIDGNQEARPRQKGGAGEFHRNLSLIVVLLILQSSNRLARLV